MPQTATMRLSTIFRAFALRFFAAAMLVMLACVPARASDPLIQTAQDWLNGLGTAKARVIQTGADGRQATGTFYLNRPGRLRFEYDPPVMDFIVADGYFIHFYDAEMQEVSNAPIGQTLADFILRDHLNLSDPKSDLVVEETRHAGNIFRLVLVQSEDPYAGSVMLDFTKEPFQLVQWVIADAQGGTTQVELLDLERDQQLAGTLFRFVDPNEKKGGRFNN